MKILITGADGFLGSNLVRELIARNHKIKALLQKGRSTAAIEGFDIEHCHGDILNKADVLVATMGCDAVIHMAANVNYWPARSEHVRNVNIKGTQNVIEAVKQCDVKRLIHISTANTFGFGTIENPGVESNTYRSAKYGLDYMDSKLQAQQLVLQQTAKGLPAIVINPTFMFGPYDTLPAGGSMIIAIYKRKLPGYTIGGRNFISVKDVAVGIANALTKGRIGECYICGNVNYSYKQMFDTIGTTIGAKPPHFKIPKALILLYGIINSTAAAVRKKRPIVSYQTALIACDQHYYSSAKAIQELDLPQTPIQIAIQEAFEWFNQNGYITTNKK